MDTYTPGAVDTHTHLEQRTRHTHTDTHTHLEQWAHTHTHLEQWAHTPAHTHTWSSQRCGARGAVGGSVPCSRVSPQSWTIPAGAENPQPQITSPALYPLGHGCTSIITYSYTVVLHIQCGSVKSNAILIKNTQTYKVILNCIWNSFKCQIFSEIWMNEIPCFIIIILHIYFRDHNIARGWLLCASAVIM